MTDDYQYVQTKLIPNPTEEFGFGGKSSEGLGVTVGNNPDAAGRPGRAFNGFEVPTQPDIAVVFPQPPQPSGSGGGVGNI